LSTGWYSSTQRPKAFLRRADQLSGVKFVKLVALIGKNTNLAARAAALAATGLLAATVASGAQAAVVIATYTGTVSSGVDQAGFFGTQGADLTGDSFTAVYTLDTASTANLSEYYSAYQDSLQYGSGESSITINGVTRTSPYVQDYLYAQPGFEQISGWSNLLIGNVYYEYTAFVFGDGLLTSIDPAVPVSYTITDGDGFGGADADGFGGGGSFTGYDGNGNNTDLNFETDTVDVTTDAAAVPEPATWMIMIVGFGMIGAAMRRRRTNITVAC
jgi:hypothetical protein